jgi:hypothetical protein
LGAQTKASQTSAAPSAVLPLRVLYAGDGETEHARAFADFLERHTKGCKSVARDKVHCADLDGFDVVLVDGELYEKDSLGNACGRREIAKMDVAALSKKPLVLVGAVGGLVSQQLELKTAWVFR